MNNENDTKFNACGIMYSTGYPPYCKDCSHSENWHRANLKHEGKILTCYGISCICTRRFD